MALSARVDVLTAPAGTGNQTYNLPASWGTPKLLLFFSSGRTATGAADASGVLAHGAASYRGAAVQQAYVTTFDTDVGTSSNTAAGNGTTAALKIFSNATPTTGVEVRLVSLGADQYVLNWVTTTSGVKVFVVALGGDDITDAYVDFFTPATGTGTQNIALPAGFGKPDLIIPFSSDGSSGDVGTNPARNILGATHWTGGAAESRVTEFSIEDATTTMTGAHAQRAKAIIQFTGQTVNLEADITDPTNWPTDGFQINKTVAGGVDRHYYAVLKGTFKKKIAAVTMPASTGNQTTALGFPGKIALLWGGSLPATAGVDTTHADLGGMFIGATDGSTEGFVGRTQDDGNTDAWAGVVHNETKAFGAYKPGATATATPVLLGEADGSFSGNDLVLNWTTTTSGRELNVLVLGDADSGSPQNVNVTGLGSAAAIGTVTTTANFNRSVTGLGSAGAFGTVTPTPGNVNRSITGLGSAGAIGSLTTQVGNVNVSVAGLGSAAAIGTVTASQGGEAQSVNVTGLGSAGAFGAVSVQTNFNRSVTGLGSAGSFGTVTAQPGGVNRAITGLGSAGAFGALTAVPGARNVSVTGLGSAGAFGSVSTLTGNTNVTVVGLGSAAQFGGLTATGGEPPAIPGGFNRRWRQRRKF
jgi:hypothetical protein